MENERLSRGFTLVGAMVALLVLGVVLQGLLSAGTHTFKLSRSVAQEFDWTNASNSVLQALQNEATCAASLRGLYGNSVLHLRLGSGWPQASAPVYAVLLGGEKVVSSEEAFRRQGWRFPVLELRFVRDDGLITTPLNGVPTELHQFGAKLYVVAQRDMKDAIGSPSFAREFDLTVQAEPNGTGGQFRRVLKCSSRPLVASQDEHTCVNLLGGVYQAGAVPPCRVSTPAPVVWQSRTFSARFNCKDGPNDYVRGIPWYEQCPGNDDPVPPAPGNSVNWKIAVDDPSGQFPPNGLGEFHRIPMTNNDPPMRVFERNYRAGVWDPNAQCGDSDFPVPGTPTNPHGNTHCEAFGYERHRIWLHRDNPEAGLHVVAPASLVGTPAASVPFTPNVCFVATYHTQTNGLPSRGKNGNSGDCQVAYAGPLGNQQWYGIVARTHRSSIACSFFCQ
ncbi:MAG: hypothetical protein AB7P04_10495 [Bacteriovoracia bacterium]